MRLIAQKAKHETVNLRDSGARCIRAGVFPASFRKTFFLSALLAFGVGALFAQGADALAAAPQPASFQFPAWLIKGLGYIGAARLALKPFQNWLQGLFTALVARVNESEETDDDALLQRVASSLWYRAVAFGADYLLSLKLPTSKSLLNHRQKFSP